MHKQGRHSDKGSPPITLYLYILSFQFVIFLLYLTKPFEISLNVAETASIFLICLNSLLNPLVYFWRYREIRQIVKSTIQKILCKDENMT